MSEMSIRGFLVLMVQLIVSGQQSHFHFDCVEIQSKNARSWIGWSSAGSSTQESYCLSPFERHQLQNAKPEQAILSVRQSLCQTSY
jgi:hypothetical protein